MLGGKGASYRNAAAGDRIEEHGLHLWAGCYENAFRVIRECYEELGRSPDQPLATWEDAFTPQSLIVLEDQHDGGWHHWLQEFPVLPTRPGETDRIASPFEMFASLLRWMAGVCRHRAWTPPWTAHLRTIEDVADRLAEGTPLFSHRLLGFAVDKLRDTARLFLRPFMKDPEIRRMWMTLDFLASNVSGILDEGFLGPGSWLDNVSRIDHLGYREWLARHGASRETTAAPMVRGLGDAVFNSNFRGAAGDGAQRARSAEHDIPGLALLSNERGHGRDDLHAALSRPEASRGPLRVLPSGRPPRCGGRSSQTGGADADAAFEGRRLSSAGRRGRHPVLETAPGRGAARRGRSPHRARRLRGGGARRAGGCAAADHHRARRAERALAHDAGHGEDDEDPVPPDLVRSGSRRARLAARVAGDDGLRGVARHLGAT